ncbi:MAG: copper resistance protein CopC [Chloroflexi bacterium]|nr:copper resistance protein CopC [Chloroflexota bacterium]
MKRWIFLLGLIALSACASPVPPTHQAMPEKIGVPHFVDSAPNNGDIFAVAPIRVVVNFDVALGDASAITVTRDGAPLALGALTFGLHKISMAATLPRDAGDGAYVVKFKACQADGTCPEGQFAFKVDSKIKNSYADFTGNRTITIRMKDIKFVPATIVVSVGTTITWLNDDAVDHFVNSDPHPSHNALPALNSFTLKPGEQYSFTFDQPSEWAYHCSAHVPAKMVGRIVVK